MKKNQRTWLIVCILLLVSGIAGWLLYQNYALQSALGGFTTETDANFIVKDYALGIETDATEDVNISVYGKDISALTADEIDDLVFADYALLETCQSGESFEDLDADWSYWCKAFGTDFVSQWFQPVLGDNIIYMMNETEDVSILCYSTPAFSTAINNTDYRNWVIEAVTLDAAESVTAKTTSVEGYLSAYDFENNNDLCVVVRLQFNTTASTAYAELDVANTEIASGNYLYYEIDTALVGSAHYDMKLASTIGTSFELVSIALGYGDADSMNVWDSQ